MCRISLIDSAALIVLIGLCAFAVGGRSGPWAMPTSAALATAYVVYKLVRVALELRSGVSVGTGLGDVDYHRLARPWAFWWAISVEVASLLLGAGIAAWLWARFASA